MSVEFTLEELAGKVGGRVIGNGRTAIAGVATLTADVPPGRISFLTNPRYRKHLAGTKASAVILAERDAQQCPIPALIVPNPHVAYARIAALFAPQPHAQAGIHPSAVVDQRAKVDPSASIGPHCTVAAGAVIEAEVNLGSGCVVGNDCRIGEGSQLLGNVTVYYGCHIGKRALIHAGAVIGSDGFGFANDQGRWVKVAQLGCVIVGDDVEIGANTTIDRGAIEDTLIGDGVKLDNLIQVAHNVRIGEHTVVAANVGIAGSAHIGARCAIGGGVGILGHLEIVDGVTVTPTSFVTNSITRPGVYSSGTPLEPKAQWQKNYARFKQLDEMARRIRALEKLLKDKEEG